MNMPFDNQIPEQLLHHANMAEQWFLEQKYNPDDYVSCDPSDVLQAARKLSTALARDPTLEKPSLEWRIFIHALTELAQMVTAVLSELTQGRQISCLILLRPAQELAQTVWHALKEGELVEWQQYSIWEDIEDLQEMKLMMEKTLAEETSKSDQLSIEISELGKEDINKCETRIQELKVLEMDLGNQRSEMEWKELRNYWRPTEKIFVERLEKVDSKAKLNDIHKFNWMVLNGYVHARSREFGPQPTVSGTISQLRSTFVYINLVIEELTKKFTMQQGITPSSTEE